MIPPDHRETIASMKAEIPRLRRFARYMTRDADYSDDLVQECLTRAIANIGSWQPGTNLRAWLFVILKNVFRNDKRRAQHDMAYRSGLERDAPLVAPPSSTITLFCRRSKRPFFSSRKITERC